MRALLLVMVVSAFGCATLSSNRFTSVDALKKVTQKPRPAKVFTDKSVDVDTWTLSGPLPTQYADAPHETESVFAPTLAEQAAKKGFRTSGPLACVARELARFSVEKAGQPTQPLSLFIAARCGVPHGTRTRWLTGTMPEDPTNATLKAQWTDDVVKLIAAVQPGERAGIAVERKGEQVAVVLAHVSDETTLEPTSMTPDAEGMVLVRGVTSRRADTLYGTTNQGRTGSAECISTQKVEAPRFELKCPVLKSDETAWISIGAREKGRVLGFEVLRLLALPSGAPATTWRAPTLVKAAPGTSAADFVAQLNVVRAEAGARPLTLSEAQTKDHTELAPFFFQAVSNGDAAEEDAIALGVMAGWRVEQDIMNGNFAATSVDGSTVAELLAELLDAPGYRQGLLSPRAGVLAVGLFQEGQALAGLISAYEPVQALTWPTTSDKVLTALNGQRARAGKKPVQWVLLPSSAEPTFAEGVAKQEYDSEEALQRFMSAATTVTQRSVSGWRIRTYDLDDVRWPSEVLEQDQLELMFFVTTERDRKDPWGGYVLVMVILKGAAQPST